MVMNHWKCQPCKRRSGISSIAVD